jgi:hypothetical protein
MLEFLIDDIFVEFGRHIFNISSGTNCVLLVDLFLYSYEAEIIQKRIKDKNK